MLRIAAGAIAGVVIWWAMVFVIDFGIRSGWHDYAAVEKAMTFTVPMLVARLSMSGISSLVSGAIATTIGRNGLKPALGAGLILLILFAPIHYSIWSRFPVWYHTTFLTSLIVLSVLGGALARRNASAIQPA